MTITSRLVSTLRWVAAPPASSLLTSVVLMSASIDLGGAVRGRCGPAVLRDVAKAGVRPAEDASCQPFHPKRAKVNLACGVTKIVTRRGLGARASWIGPPPASGR